LAVRDAEDNALAGQAARLFFDQQVSKVEIADRLAISRFRVARLIDLALERGLVRIEFRDMPARDRHTAKAIEDRFGIDLCVVAAEGGDAAGRTLPRLAAEVVAEFIGEGDVVGIAWGATLAAVVAELPTRSDPSVRVLQLAGSSTRVKPEEAPGELARRLAERLGGDYRPLFAPAFVEAAQLRDALLREADIAEIVAEYARLSLAVVGIGAFHGAGELHGEDEPAGSSLIQVGVLSKDDLTEMEDTGAVGDLILYPFDRAGAFVAPHLTARAIAISVEQLRKVPRVIAVAGGSWKAEAIAGALATGVINVLVTDHEAADLLATGAGLAEETRSRGPRTRRARARKPRDDRSPSSPTSIGS
jgi:DNA-binding transcriptional regulator LsrR (DeoR family)